MTNSNPRGASWQRNFHKIPRSIHASLRQISDNLIVVAATKKIAISDIDSGVYRHLGLRREGSTIIVPQPVIPPASVGIFSRRNVDGWEIVRKDLPMVTKTYSWETPNFGDASTYGTHTHYQDREVYQRDYFEPPFMKISMEILKQQQGSETVLIKFVVENTLDRTRLDFDDDLFFCLNLLQENTGVVGVYPSTASREDFIRTIMLDWEIFPPGTIDEIVAMLTRGRGVRGDRVDIVAERVKLFQKLKPTAYIRGTGSFGSYIGARFADDLIVFENVTYGNALYVLYDGWEEISKRSRLDLLKGITANFDRFLHVHGWEERFIEHMRNEIDKRGLGKDWRWVG